LSMLTTTFKKSYIELSWTMETILLAILCSKSKQEI
jgi:hypothetical protein